MHLYPMLSELPGQCPDKISLEINCMLKINAFIVILCISSLSGCATALPVDETPVTEKPKLSSQSNAITVSTFDAISDAPLVQEQRFMVEEAVPARVFVLETTVMVQTGNKPAIALESIYPHLYQGWRQQYIKVRDFDGDGLTDLAILQSVGHGGHNRCYAIYRFDPRTNQYRARKSFDRCNV